MLDDAVLELSLRGLQGLYFLDIHVDRIACSARNLHCCIDGGFLEATDRPEYADASIKRSRCEALIPKFVHVWRHPLAMFSKGSEFLEIPRITQAASPHGSFQSSWAEASPDEKALFLEAFGESGKLLRERWDKATPEERKPFAGIRCSGRAR